MRSRISRRTRSTASSSGFGSIVPTSPPKISAASAGESSLPVILPTVPDQGFNIGGFILIRRIHPAQQFHDIAPVPSIERRITVRAVRQIKPKRYENPCSHEKTEGTRRLSPHFDHGRVAISHSLKGRFHPEPRLADQLFSWSTDDKGLDQPIELSANRWVNRWIERHNTPLRRSFVASRRNITGIVPPAHLPPRRPWKAEPSLTPLFRKIETTHRQSPATGFPRPQQLLCHQRR